jgi:hypothetical protein
MRIYVMVDAEGLCGIHLRSQVMPDGERYGELRRLMTDEINHVVKALKDAGASRVLVRDAHAAGNNVLWSQLTDLADGYIMGNSPGNACRVWQTTMRLSCWATTRWPEPRGHPGTHHVVQGLAELLD